MIHVNTKLKNPKSKIQKIHLATALRLFGFEIRLAGCETTLLRCGSIAVNGTSSDERGISAYLRLMNRLSAGRQGEGETLAG
jgi:hypothetical protein